MRYKLGLAASVALIALWFAWIEDPAPVLAIAAEPRVQRSSLVVEPRVVLPEDFPSAEPPDMGWIPVSGDVPALVGPGFAHTPQVIVYLHGMCGDPERVRQWAAAAQAFGTVIALRGGSPCANRASGHYWNGDPVYLDYRIKKSIRSVAAALGRPLDESAPILIGYSQGAQRAEDLAWIFPKRYARLALMSGPSAPAWQKIAKTRTLAITRGEREYDKSWRQAAERFRETGKLARYFELPGAAHGEFGPEAPHAMRDVLAHVAQ